MTVYQWSDHCFAAYVGVTSRPFSGRFVGTEQTREGAQCVAAQAQHAGRPALRGVQVCEDRGAGSACTTPGPAARLGRANVRRTWPPRPPRSDRS
jgi:hypothetical protein